MANDSTKARMGSCGHKKLNQQSRRYRSWVIDWLESLSGWETLLEAIDRHKEAIRISRREGGKLPA